MTSLYLYTASFERIRIYAGKSYTQHSTAQNSKADDPS